MLSSLISRKTSLVFFIERINNKAKASLLNLSSTNRFSLTFINAFAICSHIFISLSGLWSREKSSIVSFLLWGNTIAKTLFIRVILCFCSCVRRLVPIEDGVRACMYLLNIIECELLYSNSSVRSSSVLMVLMGYCPLSFTTTLMLSLPNNSVQTEMIAVFAASIGK